MAMNGRENYWQKLADRYFMHFVDRVPLTLVKGSGLWVWDDRGEKYLDFVGGWAVDSLGHCHPAVTGAVIGQVQKLIHTSNQFYTIPQVQLAEILINHSCLDRVFFCNSGAEANEGAVKLARRYGGKNLDGAYEVITTSSSFHGRTLAMVAATGQDKHQQPYHPLPTGFVNVNYNDIEAIKGATTSKTCAIMLELVQGEGGVNLPEQNYIKAVRDWCDKKGILLMLDEVQTGVSRLGTLFAYEQYGIEPDVLTLAKGLASGIPIGAIMSKEAASVFTPGEHGSTFGGNPVACAAGYATIKYIVENNISANVRDVGKYLLHGLSKIKEKFSFVVDIRGQGLLLAMEFSDDIAYKVLMACLNNGLLVNRVKPNAIRLMPPLICSKEEANKALVMLEQALSSVTR